MALRLFQLSIQRLPWHFPWGCYSGQYVRLPTPLNLLAILGMDEAVPPVHYALILWALHENRDFTIRTALYTDEKNVVGKEE